MTLLLTEVHCPSGELSESVIIFGADRRISIAGRPHGTKKKLFEVPSLQGGLGFFGLAEFSVGTTRLSMSDWLKRFGETRAGMSGSLGDFAQSLAEALNQLVPRPIRQKEVSGFHLAGLNRDSVPEFWFIRNIEDDGRTVTGTYSAREDFLRRDVMKMHTGETFIVSYRNGDIRGHIAAWERLDESFFKLLQMPEFKAPRTSKEYGDWVKFKMEVLAYFYKKYCRISIVGRPIDTLVLRD